VIQPAEDPPLKPATAVTAGPLSDGDLAELVTNLRGAPLGAGGRVRVALAGVHEKLFLTRLPDGVMGTTQGRHAIDPGPQTGARCLPEDRRQTMTFVCASPDTSATVQVAQVAVR
jgi:hypothetical protein